MKYADLSLGTIEAVFNKLGGLDGAQAFLRDEVTVAKPATSKLLELVTSVAVVGLAPFAAKDKFKTKKTPDGVKLYWVGDNFKENFLEKVEGEAAPATLKLHMLKKSSLDAPILAELGEEAQETKLSHLWELLQKQPEGEKGTLLVNGYANIFYVRDTKGNLWAVCADWRSGYGWDFEASSVENPREWGGGSQVVSR